MSGGYSEEDAILQAKLSLIETQKHCKHAQEWIMVVREWMALAYLIREGNHGTVRPEQAETDELQESGGQNS